MTRELKTGNLFAAGENTATAEKFLTLLQSDNVKIERIISRNHSSPLGFWYDQPENEWVMVVRGAAVVEFASGEIVEMSEGDYLFIPRHVRHRVARTSDMTIWLAVHVK